MILTRQQANQVYDILIEFAGATESQRDEFVHIQSTEECREYRFSGHLGFGGKFRNRESHYSNCGMSVDCYPEDANPTRDNVILATNAALTRLREREKF